MGEEDNEHEIQNREEESKSFSPQKEHKSDRPRSCLSEYLRINMKDLKIEDGKVEGSLYIASQTEIVRESRLIVKE